LYVKIVLIVNLFFLDGFSN